MKKIYKSYILFIMFFVFLLFLSQNIMVLHAGSETIPTRESVELLFSEALELGYIISNAEEDSLPQINKKFEEATNTLIFIGKTYPEHREYYREILINDPDLGRKGMAAELLIDANDEKVGDILIEFLDSEIPAIRILAVLHLDVINDKRIVPKLEVIAEHDSDIRVKTFAAAILKSIKADTQAKSKK